MNVRAMVRLRGRHEDVRMQLLVRLAYVRTFRPYRSVRVSGAADVDLQRSTRAYRSIGAATLRSTLPHVHVSLLRYFPHSDLSLH